MTAIFAMVRGDALFVAGDTRRGSILSTCVQKVHNWGDEVLLGQCGNGRQQSELIAELKLGRCMAAQRGEQDLFGLYNARRLKHVANVTAPARPNGTLLVAALSTVSAFPAIVEYEFATGKRTQLSRTVAAIGTDSVALTAIADLHARRLGGRPSFPLDDWAKACVADAIAAFPNDVDWPCDMAVARASPLGGRLVAERRIYAASTTGLAEFAV